MWTIDPQIPLSLWWVLAAFAVAAVAWYLVRFDWNQSKQKRLFFTAMLALGLVGPLLIALNPTWVETIPPLPGKPTLTVLLDGTMSMNTTDMDDSKSQSRWQRGLQLANQVESKNGELEIRQFAIGVDLKPIDFGRLQKDSNKSNRENEDPNAAWPQGHRSDLAMAIRQSIRSGSPLGHAILLISDGAHNVGSTEGLLQSAREANALATPIYTVTLGSSLGMKNLSLTAKSPRMLSFPETPITIRAMVGHSGLHGSTTQVQLLHDDQVIQSQSIRLNDPMQEVRFVVEPKAGAVPLDRYQIVASEVSGEVTTADNETSILVQQLNSPIEVLVLEGKPYWDTKFLLRNLANDSVVNLTTIVRLGSNRYLLRRSEQAAVSRSTTTSTSTTAAATSEETSNTSNDSTLANYNQQASNANSDKSNQWEVQEQLVSPLESDHLLEKYRLVILGRDAGAYLTPTAIDNLRAWVSKNGGCLLCSRGAPTDQMAAKLAEILPVRWARNREESRVHPEVTQHAMDTSVFDPLLSEGIDPIGSMPTLAVGSQPKMRTGLPQVLMQSAVTGGETIPIVTYQPLGAGQTIVVEGAGMWRWAFLSPEHANKDKIYPTLWQSMIQWIISQQDMLPGQDISIRPDRATYLAGDRASASVTLKNPANWAIEELSVLLQTAEFDLPKRLTLTASGVDNGLFRVDLGSLEVGYYSLKVVRGESDQTLAAGAFEVRDPWFESLEVDARPDVMRQVSRLSGGEVLDQREVGQLVERFTEQIRNQQKHEETRTTMWDRPWVLLLVLGSWITSWIVRRRNGIV
ncbi:MAG: hypothetical protein U0930_17080 [Pirellulales bacterium]